MWKNGMIIFAIQHLQTLTKTFNWIKNESIIIISYTKIILIKYFYIQTNPWSRNVLANKQTIKHISFFRFTLFTYIQFTSHTHTYTHTHLYIYIYIYIYIYYAYEYVFLIIVIISCLNFWDESCWFLSLRVFRLLSSSLLLFPQRFGRYVRRPSSSVCRTREPTRKFELRPSVKPPGFQ